MEDRRRRRVAFEERAQLRRGRLNVAPRASSIITRQGSAKGCRTCRSMQLSPSNSHGGIQESFEKVAKDEARKLSTVQEVMLRSTDYVRRIIAPPAGQGGVTMSWLCPHCNRFPEEEAICEKKKMIGGRQTGCWWCKQAKVSTRLRSSERMRYHKACKKT